MKDKEKKFCLYNDLDQIYENGYTYSGISFSYSFDDIACIMLNDVEFPLEDIDWLEVGLGQNHLHLIFYFDNEYHYTFHIEYLNIKNFVLLEANNVYE